MPKYVVYGICRERKSDGLSDNIAHVGNRLKNCTPDLHNGTVCPDRGSPSNSFMTPRFRMVSHVRKGFYVGDSRVLAVEKYSRVAHRKSEDSGLLFRIPVSWWLPRLARSPDGGIACQSARSVA